MPDFPVYHTAFDSYDWMVNYGDPLFHRHVAITGVWGLVALHLADDAVLPLNYLSYVTQLQVYTNVLSNMLEDSVSLHPITASIQELATAAKEEEEEAKKLREQETLGNLLVLKKRTLNDRLMFAERGFLDAEGLKGRQWFKHLIYGPCRYHESKLVFFPGIVDAIAESRRMNKKEGQAAIQHEVWRVARAIQRAAFALRGELT
ncbi:glutamate carboxypeptidase II [Sarracenia purpurea var. burkii]